MRRQGSHADLKLRANTFSVDLESIFRDRQSRAEQRAPFASRDEISPRRDGPAAIRRQIWPVSSLSSAWVASDRSMYFRDDLHP